MLALLAQVNAAVLASPLAEDEVTYTSGAGAVATPRGIFDALYVKADAGGVGVSSAGPAVFLRLADLSSDPETDQDARVTIREQDYSIHEVQPDGQGAAVLLLHEV
jgi:hypothetical protein